MSLTFFFKIDNYRSNLIIYLQMVINFLFKPIYELFHIYTFEGTRNYFKNV